MVAQLRFRTHELLYEEIENIIADILSKNNVKYWQNKTAVLLIETLLGQIKMIKNGSPPYSIQKQQKSLNQEHAKFISANFFGIFRMWIWYLLQQFLVSSAKLSGIFRKSI